MYPSFERDLISKVKTLHNGEIEAGKFCNEIIKLFAENLDVIWEELSPLLKAIRVKDHAIKPGFTARKASQVQRVVELRQLSVPERLAIYLDDEWKHKPLNFWGMSINDVASPRPANKISLLYTRVSSSTDDSNLYRKFAAVAIYHGATKLAKEQKWKRLTKHRIDRVIQWLVEKVIKDQTDDVEKDRIGEVFRSLYNAGIRWCDWAELVGGYGAFFVHPPCVHMSMIERNLTTTNLEAIAAHLKTIGIGSLATKYKEVADGILKSVEEHWDFSPPSRKRPSECADESITANSVSPGACKSPGSRKRAKVYQDRILPRHEVDGDEIELQLPADWFRHTDPDVSLANYLVESENRYTLQSTASHYPLQLMEDPAPTNPDISLANHLVESENRYTLQSTTSPYPLQLMEDPAPTDPCVSLAHHLVESKDYQYIQHFTRHPDVTVLQSTDNSGATNTGVCLSSDQCFVPTTAIVSGSKPQPPVICLNDRRANVNSPYPVDYPYHNSNSNTAIEQAQVSNTVNMAAILQEWHNNPYLAFMVGDPASQGTDSVPPPAGHFHTQQRLGSGTVDYTETSQSMQSSAQQSSTMDRLG